MDIQRSRLQAAEAKGLISKEQEELLWQFLSEQSDDRPKFGLTHVLYYLGGMVAIGAMTLFMTMGFEAFGGGAICAIGIAYMIAAVMLTEFFLRRKGLKIPAGIMAAFAVALTPLVIYGLQHAMGWWTDTHSYRDYHYWVDWRWVVMEFGTLIVGAIMLWRYRLPFSVMPVAVTLWYMSMDVAAMLIVTSDNWQAEWETRCHVSIAFGVAMILLAFWVDLRSRHGADFAFWLYVYGVLTFWGGLTSLPHTDDPLRKAVYFVINLALIFSGVTIGRRVFVVFGGLGVACYLGDLSYTVFKDSMMFPFALTLIGLGIIGVGVYWQRHEAAFTARFHALLPTPLRELIERRR